MRNLFAAALSLIYLCSAVALAADQPAAASLKLTLDDAVSLALRDNRGLRLKAEEVNKAAALIAEARASLFPSLTASGSWSQTRQLYDKDPGVYAGQAGIKQVLYKGGQIINAIKVGEHVYAAAEAGRDQAKASVIAATKRAFYTVLLAQEFVGLNRQIRDNTRMHTQALQQRFQRGLVSAADVSAVESSLQTVEQEYAASLNQERIALEALKNILAVDQAADLQPDGAFIYDPREIAYDEAFLQAMKARPELRQLQEQLKAGEKAVAIARAGNQPSVAASWDYYARSHGLTGTAKNRNDYNVLAVSVSWPVFDGWLTKAKVEQALVDLRQAQLLKDKGIRDVASDLQQAYLMLADAIARVPAAESEALVFRRRFEELQEKFKQGIASQLDKDDAALRYAVAQFNRSQALYDYSVAKVAFEKAQGGSL